MTNCKDCGIEIEVGTIYRVCEPCRVKFNRAAVDREFGEEAAAEHHANPAGLTKLSLPVRGHMDRSRDSFLAGVEWQKARAILEKTCVNASCPKCRSGEPCQ